MTRLADVNPDTAGTELETTAHALTRQLGLDVAIASRADLEQAVTDRATVADAMATVERFFAPLKQLFHRGHATLCEREREILAPLRALDAARKAAITDFKAREDRERAEREQQLAAQQRRDREARATIEAAALESQGQPAIAAAVIAEALAAPALPVSLPDATKVSGLAFRRRWSWRYAGGPNEVSTTPDAIKARAIAAMPTEFLMVDEARLGQYARAMKAAAKVPGIEFYSVDEPVRR